MEIDIKEYLNNHEELVKLIGHSRFFPLFTTDINKPSIVYNFTPLSGGHVKQSQLELKIIWSDYDECKEIEGAINNLLDMEEDVPFITYRKTRFKSSLGGGGCLFRDDLQMYENTLIFMITWRCI